LYSYSWEDCFINSSYNLDSRYISCTLSHEYLEVLSGLIEQNAEFTDISIITDTNITSLIALEPEVIPEDDIWAILEIPHSTNMCHFYTEFYKALSKEEKLQGCGEKRG